MTWAIQQFTLMLERSEHQKSFFEEISHLSPMSPARHTIAAAIVEVPVQLLQLRLSSYGVSSVRLHVDQELQQVNAGCLRSVGSRPLRASTVRAESIQR